MSYDDTQSPQEEGIRINKYLASCGFESRRKADQLIADGAVEINGKRVDAPGVRVQPGDFVKVNGKRALPKDQVTILLNKPRGFVCSRDAQGAAGTVYDLLPPKYRYVNYVGRLDSDSEGLLILTNKGELNQRLGHPNNGIEKEYWVTLNQPYDNSVLLQLLKGVRIPEGQAKAKYISRLSPRRAAVVLEQGLKRQVRQMFACLGFRVKKLVRVRIGSLWGGDLLPGRTMLMTEELEKLAATNPPQRKGLVSAQQAFPNSGALSDEQLAKAMDEKAARKALEEEAHYRFNPDDFETNEEAGELPARDWDEEEDFGFPSPQRERFSRRHAPRRDDGESRSFGERGRRYSRRDDAPRSFRDKRGFDSRRHNADDRERSFSRRSGSGRGFSSRRDFGERENRYNRTGDAPRRAYGERRSGSTRDFSARSSFDNRSGERRFRTTGGASRSGRSSQRRSSFGGERGRGSRPSSRSRGGRF